MIIEIGHYALVLALATSLIVSIVPLVGARRRDPAMMALAPVASITMFALVLLSFAVLTWGYVVSDFSVRNVWENSHSMKPMIYKLSGVWGNHAGSMMLWLLIIVMFSALVVDFAPNLPAQMRAIALAGQG